MKPFNNSRIPLAIVALVLAAAFFAGCTAEPAKIPGAAPAATAPGAQAAAVGGPVSLPYGVTLTLPADWSRQDVMTSDIRDYGRRAVRIATFSSPVTIPGDVTSANTLSVDIDENPGADFEAYFNQATLALQDYYKTRLDSHSIVKSGTLTVSGAKAYQLDFQTEDVKGYYIFTKTDKGMYILAFRGENKPTAVRALQGRTEEIVKSVTIAP